MGRGHLQASRPKLHVHIRIANDGYAPAADGHDGHLPMQVRISSILGMHTNRRIPQNRLRPGGGDGHALRIPLHRIPHMVQLAPLLLVNHFLIAQRRQRHRIPVHHAHSPVDITFSVQIDERIDHALIVLLVHREAGPIPVARGAELLQLLEDDAPMLMGPLPRVLQKRLATQVPLLDALLPQLSDHLRLRGNRSVIGPGHPTGILALHPSPPHQHILDGVVEHVPHVQHPRHIGRRDDHRVRLPTIRHGLEVLPLQPAVIPFLLDVLGLVGRWNFHCVLGWSSQPPRGRAGPQKSFMGPHKKTSPPVGSDVFSRLLVDLVVRRSAH